MQFHTEHRPKVESHRLGQLGRYTQMGVLACFLTGTLFVYQRTAQTPEPQFFQAQIQKSLPKQMAKLLVIQIVQQAQDRLGV